jgi:hypothetical protein
VCGGFSIHGVKGRTGQGLRNAPDARCAKDLDYRADIFEAGVEILGKRQGKRPKAGEKRKNQEKSGKIRNCQG